MKKQKWEMTWETKMGSINQKNVWEMERAIVLKYVWETPSLMRNLDKASRGIVKVKQNKHEKCSKK